ncbi:MAG: glycosyltransferase family 39 protein [Acidimicrobiales bacterium]
MTGTAPTTPVAGSSPRASGSSRTARWAIAVVVAAAVVLGILMRAWYLVRDPINSDQALIGLDARRILAGHLHAFLPGLHYEAVGPYLVAAVFWLFGSSPTALDVPVVLCDAVACILVWRIALRLSERGDIAAICAAAMWVAPQSAIWNSTMEYGFRGVTLLCGTGMLLVSLRLRQGSCRWWDAPLLGALLGVGWWSSPEIVYFALPSAIWTAGWLWRARREPSGISRRAIEAVGVLLTACIGALPWLWDNVTKGFPSLSVSKYDLPVVVPSYSSRLGDFFRGALPTVLDLRVPRSGAWDMPAALGVVALVLIGAGIVGAALWQLWCRGDGFAVALAVLSYPLILAASPVSADWLAARYTNFLVPLLALLAAATIGRASARSREGPRRARRPTPLSSQPVLSPKAALAVCVLAIGLIVTSVVAFGDLRSINVLPGARLGSSANGPASRLVAGLERAGVEGGYADYWVAYKLDFLAAGRLGVADTPPSPDRLPFLHAEARALPAREQAWLFVHPSPTARTEYADTAVIRGPSGLTLSAFESDMKGLGVHYRVLDIAGAEAVVCARRITPAEVGLHPVAGR